MGSIHFHQKRSRAVVLVFSAGILTILAAMGTALYALTYSSTLSAVRYSDAVRADFLCRAGVAEAIARLRNQAYIKTEDPGDTWFTVDYLRGLKGKTSYRFCNGMDDDGDGIIDNENEVERPYARSLGSSVGDNSDRFVLEVSDAASKINVNAGDNLAVILDNLCRVIGPPLVAANLDALQPRRWAEEADAADPDRALFDTAENTNDTASSRDIYFELGAHQRPKLAADGTALYGDAYAIAGHRARHGAFRNLEEVKKALTYVERNANGVLDDPLEQMEIEIKFAALRNHITVGSWVDTNTVCVGKFEWIHFDSSTGKTYAMDRDKSWVIDKPTDDPLNQRGSLRGCYLSIMNGHGAGQLRRIRTNGIDWVEVEGGFAVTPGPISSYMIIAPEDSMLMDVNGTASSYSYPDKLPPEGTVTLPQTNADGTLVDNPKIDYAAHPLCIHRAPVNINTATDKVLAALFLGINVQHGHPLAVGTETEVPKLRTKWKITDPQQIQPWNKNDCVQPYLLTPAGLKRIPASSGKPILTKSWGGGTGDVLPPPAIYDAAYINNYDMVDVPGNWVSSGTGLMNEAHELAYRIVMARQNDKAQPALKFIDPLTGGPTANDKDAYGRLHPRRGPFRNYDDFYFRVIKPWDEKRFSDGAGLKARVSTMLMANFNANTDILKFNPNIEWIDRWSRNYTDQEPVMVYTNEAYPANGIFTADVPAATTITASSVPIYTAVTDPNAGGWDNTKCPPLYSSQKDSGGNHILGAYITRSFRYKSDELIDKSDLNRSTTEFSFDSNGTFYVVSSGQVLNKATGQLLAERKMEALVKVYDVWRESTQQQFVMGTISKADGVRTDKSQLSYTGQLARDASGLVEAKGLTTLPEPLLPLKARIVDVAGNTNSKNYEAVSSIEAGVDPYEPLDAFGNPRKNPYDPDPTLKGIHVPEVLANRVLPARWDGQIVLSTNTSSFDPSQSGDDDSFLASFDGDTDTATCLGNGREQAKWPYSAEPDGAGGFKYTGKGHHYRCVQSIGLLGILNDVMVSTDPGIPLVNGSTPFSNWADKDAVRWVYPFIGVSSALMPLSLGADPDHPMYWNNISVRMGSLRTDGAYLTAPGVSGNTATLKYPFTPGSAVSHSAPTGTVRKTKLNFQPDSKNGTLITMWIKPVWHHDDMRMHEFFNCSNEAQVNHCEKYFFAKYGQYKWCSANQHNGLGGCANRRELNDLSAVFTYQHDSGYGASLHGGFSGIDASASPNESPSYRVQPFRWSYLGLRVNYGTDYPAPDGEDGPGESMGPRGHMAVNEDWESISHRNIIRHYIRPFIDTALFPEGSTSWPSAATGGNAERLMWTYRGCSSWGGTNESMMGNSRDVVGGATSTSQPNPTEGGRTAEAQDVKWAWAEPYGKVGEDPDAPGYSLKSFGMNNLNYGNKEYNQNFNVASGGGTAGNLRWHYRHMPEDGTYAVIDEFKISNRDYVLRDDNSPLWSKDRGTREMKISRYYLPPHPGTRYAPSAGGPPTFTSQTLLQSLKGFDKSTARQNVIVVRVNWNVFTPRFMTEYQETSATRFKRDEKLTHFNSIGAAQANVSVPFKGPFDYVRYNDGGDLGLDSNPQGTAYSANRPAPQNYPDDIAHASKGVEVELLQDKGSGVPTILAGKTFTNPTALNKLGELNAPVWCLPSELRYRVRFRYPVDPLVDPYCTTKETDPERPNWPRVDPTKQYLLDTPVFDDISVTYILPVRVLDFREVTE